MIDTRRISAMLAAGLLTLGSIGAANAGLGDEVRQLAGETSDRVWLSYTVPMLDGDHDLCCQGDRGNHGGCDLAGNSFSMSTDSDFAAGPDRELSVFLRLDEGKLTRVRAYDTRCRIDARRGTVHQIDGIDAGDSVAFLSGQLRSASEKLRDGALMAIAFHDHQSAARLLTAATQTRETAELRENAAFWLGATRAEESFETLRRMVLEDPDADVRQHGVFVLSMSESARATEFLFELARESDEGKIRGQALFWLGQKAGDHVAETLASAAFEDPELEVKEQAVFALSQLPEGEGVTRLIRVATTHKQPEIRQSALFWLGQSDDPRALDLFERILE